MVPPAEVNERAGRIQLLLLDVDGVLTDGRIVVGADGEERKSFHSRDGLGIRLLQAANVEVGLVSGRRSSAVERRAAELDLEEVLLGIGDKVAAVAELLDRRQLAWADIGFVGDDLVDLPVLRRVGFAAAVPEAPPEVCAHVHMVTVATGGAGAVREIAELILRARGAWQHVLERYDAI